MACNTSLVTKIVYCKLPKDALQRYLREVWYTSPWACRCSVFDKFIYNSWTVGQICSFLVQLKTNPDDFKEYDKQLISMPMFTFWGAEEELFDRQFNLQFPGQAKVWPRCFWKVWYTISRANQCSASVQLMYNFLTTSRIYSFPVKLKCKFCIHSLRYLTNSLLSQPLTVALK